MATQWLAGLRQEDQIAFASLGLAAISYTLET